jgi:hypothetical protein
MSRLSREAFNALDEDTRHKVANRIYRDNIRSYKEMDELGLMADTDDPEAAEMWAYDRVPGYMKFDL